jgi:hypothetical protein
MGWSFVAFGASDREGDRPNIPIGTPAKGRKIRRHLKNASERGKGYLAATEKSMGWVHGNA